MDDKYIYFERLQFGDSLCFILNPNLHLITLLSTFCFSGLIYFHLSYLWGGGGWVDEWARYSCRFMIFQQNALVFEMNTLSLPALIGPEDFKSWPFFLSALF